MDYYFRRKRMEKRVIIDEATDSDDEDGDYETILTFKVHHAEGIDEPRPLHSHHTRYYRVYGWINPGEEHAFSCLKSGTPNPSWNSKYSLSLGDDFDRSDHVNFLHLEVVRFEKGSKEPGPSTREVLVGRTRILLTHDLFKQKTRKFQLVRLDEAEPKSAGCIKVSMKLSKQYYGYSN